MPQNLNPASIGKFQQLIAKNPVTFVAAVFFVMFWVTYFLNINKNNDAEQYWKEMYEKEKNRNDGLTLELLIKAGVLNKKDETIQKQGEAIKKADSTLKDNLGDKIEKLIQ